MRLMLAAAVAGMSAMGTFVSTPVSAQAEPFIGQLMLFAGNFCPRGWSTASGQILPISQYTALFSLLGTTYGGNGQTTFQLPDLRGRVPISAEQGPGLSNYQLGQTGGQESVTLLNSQMPQHTHIVNATNVLANQGGPLNRYLGGGSIADNDQIYHDGPPTKTMNPAMLSPSGGSQPHENRPPYLTLQWCIALEGIFPSRN